VDIIAITKLATDPETEAPLLAADLGITAYEARQKLAVGTPCVVLMTNERARTASLVSALRGRGHTAVACDGRAVVSSSAMVPVRSFHLDPDALVLDAPPGQERQAEEGVTRMPFVDIVALVRAAHRHAVETHQLTKEKKFRPAAAIISGGVILTKTVTRDVTRTNESKEQVLYIFSRGRVPCLLREASAQYAGLGEAVRPTRIENFLTTVRLLRESAPNAPYDERLISLKRAPEPANEPGAPRAFDRETGGIDLLAHLLAMSLAGPG
jgi:hypothetical protein